MNTRVKEAEERKKNGYNCAQAVACSYSDLAGIDEETAKNHLRVDLEEVWKEPVGH